MAASDAVFSGSIPAIYDRLLGPFVFEPYAHDMAERVAALSPRTLLETAAGTGLATAAIVARSPGAAVVATDLNPGMLAVAAERLGSANVELRAADMQDLPFADGAFDVVVCQFGMMFPPDRAKALREVRRVLRPDGVFLFNVWDRLEENPVTLVVQETAASLFPGDPPDFLRRTPHGHHDVAPFEQDLRKAGFGDIRVETVTFDTPGVSVRAAAEGFCLGTPLRSEIEARGGDLSQVVEAAVAALAQHAGPDGLVAHVSAHVFSARP